MNRSTTYDWLRFFWHLTTRDDYGYKATFTDVMQVIDEADPHTWNATGDTYSLDNPPGRLLLGADSSGVIGLFGAWWDWSLDHGVSYLD